MTRSDRGDLLRGTLEMLILQTLRRGAMHGYAITEAIERISQDVLKVGEGSMYPALYRMEKRGWIKSHKARSENNRIAKFYQLTAKGRRHLQGASRRWKSFSAAVDAIMGADAAEEKGP
ncbi:MAG TPA: PadR family transcriptional regulator [Acidobacteriota bacterium]|nr:PadR family transcriptional regulator [Acidobacteriota bacterium]